MGFFNELGKGLSGLTEAGRKEQQRNERNQKLLTGGTIVGVLLTTVIGLGTIVSKASEENKNTSTGSKFER